VKSTSYPNSIRCRRLDETAENTCSRGLTGCGVFQQAPKKRTGRQANSEVDDVNSVESDYADASDSKDSDM